MGNPADDGMLTLDRGRALVRPRIRVLLLVGDVRDEKGTILGQTVPEVDSKISLNSRLDSFFQ